MIAARPLYVVGEIAMEAIGNIAYVRMRQVALQQPVPGRYNQIRFDLKHEFRSSFHVCAWLVR